MINIILLIVVIYLVIYIEKTYRPRLGIVNNNICFIISLYYNKQEGNRIRRTFKDLIYIGK